LRFEIADDTTSVEEQFEIEVKEKERDSTDQFVLLSFYLIIIISIIFVIIFFVLLGQIQKMRSETGKSEPEKKIKPKPDKKSSYAALEDDEEDYEDEIEE